MKAPLNSIPREAIEQNGTLFFRKRMLEIQAEQAQISGSST
jgi:hypothetical protein